jgi:hypothetical protein
MKSQKPLEVAVFSQTRYEAEFEPVVPFTRSRLTRMPLDAPEHMRVGLFPRSIPLLAVLLCVVPVVHAESGYGAITGVVRDPAKAPLAGAVITATELDDSTTQTTVSIVDGSYQLAGVPPGMYSVMAEKEGFSQAVVASLQISAGRTAVADFALLPPSTGPVTLDGPVQYTEPDRPQSSRIAGLCPVFNRAYYCRILFQPGSQPDLWVYRGA